MNIEHIRTFLEIAAGQIVELRQAENDPEPSFMHSGANVSFQVVSAFVLLCSVECRTAPS